MRMEDIGGLVVLLKRRKARNEVDVYDLNVSLNGVNMDGLLYSTDKLDISGTYSSTHKC